MQIPSCSKEKNNCINCNSHFAELRQNIEKVEITKHFERDLKDKQEREDIMNQILDCDAENFHEMHKFELSIKGNHIFRAKRKGVHILYCISGSRLIFLRAIKNFEEYKKFLDSEISKIL